MEHTPDQEHQEDGVIGNEGHTAGKEEMSPWKKGRHRSQQILSIKRE